jgi:hypothetical protein
MGNVFVCVIEWVFRQSGREDSIGKHEGMFLDFDVEIGLSKFWVSFGFIFLVLSLVAVTSIVAIFVAI